MKHSANIIMTVCLSAVGVLMLTDCKGEKKNGIGAYPSDTVNSAVHAVPAPVGTKAENDTVANFPYDIPAQRFDMTVQDLRHGSSVNIVTDLMKTGPVKVNAVEGHMNTLQAVQTAIKDTPLKITKVTPAEITVVYDGD